MSRAREEEEEEEEDLDSKRSLTTPSSTSTILNHYDIYLIPTSLPLFNPPPSFPSFPESTIQSASFLIVNQSAALTGLGFNYSLSISSSSSTTTAPPTFIPIKNSSFYLPRETSYDPTLAICLGWVSEDQLLNFERILFHQVELPLWSSEEGGKNKNGSEYVKEWLIESMRKLEEGGIVSNPELLSREILGKL